MKDIKYIKSIIEKYKKNSAEVDNNGVGFFLNSFGLFKQVYLTEANTSDYEIRKKEVENFNQILMNNTIVNAVTALDVFVKFIITKRQNWNEEGYNSLLDEDIKLSAAFELFNKAAVTREYLIAHSVSYQNNDIINKFFSKLTGEDFFNAIEKKEIEAPFSLTSPKTLQSIFPEWERKLKLFFEIRHKFIHEGELTIMKPEELDDYFHLILSIIASIEMYVLDRDVSLLKGTVPDTDRR